MKNRFIAKKYWNNIEPAFGNTNEKAAQFDDCINLSLGDPDLITDKIIIDGAYRDALKGHTKYTPIQGDPELRNEIRRFYKEEFDMDVKDEELMVTASGLFGMFMVMQSVLDPGDEVIIQAPYFSPYKQQVELAGGIPVEMPTYEEEDFQIDFDRLKGCITPRTKALLINTPSNPTGSCLSMGTMESICSVAEEHDLLIIADDIYTAYSFENEFIPIASLPGMKERTVTVNSFSKNFLMTGWRIGNVIAPSYIIDVMKNIDESMVYSAPSVSQRAAIYALRNRHEIQPPIIEEYRKRMYYAAERINEIPWMHVIYPPKGSFYLFVNIKKSGLSSAEAVNMLLEKAHVLTIPGNAFGSCGEGYVRIACTVGIEVLKEAFDRIENIKPEAE